MEEGVGAKFWLWLGGVLLAGAAIFFVVLMLISHALYMWGFFGALVVVGLICIGFAWWFDRRNKRRPDWDVENPELPEGDVASDHRERL